MWSTWQNRCLLMCAHTIVLSMFFVQSLTCAHTEKLSCFPLVPWHAHTYTYYHVFRLLHNLWADGNIGMFSVCSLTYAVLACVLYILWHVRIHKYYHVFRMFTDLCTDNIDRYIAIFPYVSWHVRGRIVDISEQRFCRVACDSENERLTRICQNERQINPENGWLTRRRPS